MEGERRVSEGAGAQREANTVEPAITDVKGPTNYQRRIFINADDMKNEKIRSGLKGPIFYLRFRRISVTLGSIIAGVTVWKGW